MKVVNNHIQLTGKEAIRIMKCLDSLEAEGGNYTYDIDGDLDENIVGYNKQCLDAGILSRKIFKSLKQLNSVKI